jgi:hypothetical protein
MGGTDWRRPALDPKTMAVTVEVVSVITTYLFTVRTMDGTAATVQIDPRHEIEALAVDAMRKAMIGKQAEIELPYVHGQVGHGLRSGQRVTVAGMTFRGKPYHEHFAGARP